MKQNLPRASNQSCSDVRLQIGHQPQEMAAGTENRSDRTLGGVATVFHSATPPIHSCSAHSTSKETGACSMHAPHAQSAAAANNTSPEMPLAAATASNQGFGQLGNSPAARPSDRPSNGQSALSLWFRVQHHLQHANGPRLPCRSTAQVRTWLAPRLNPASTQAPLPESSIFLSSNAGMSQQRMPPRPTASPGQYKSTHPTLGGHRRPSRPLDSFLR
jgi:hypothetical protein